MKTKTRKRLEEAWYWISGKKEIPHSAYYIGLSKEFCSLSRRLEEVKKEMAERERFLVAHKVITGS